MAPHGPAYGGSGPTILGVSWTELLLITIIIVMRTYTKIMLVPRGGGWALLWAIYAWVSNLAPRSTKDSQLSMVGCWSV